MKSKQGILFHQWANTVLKDFLLRGYSVNQRLLNIERKVEEHDRKIDFFVRAAHPPAEGIFFDGQVFDAYRFTPVTVNNHSIFILPSRRKCVSLHLFLKPAL